MAIDFDIWFLSTRILTRHKIKFLAARIYCFPGEESGLHFENKITTVLKQKNRIYLLGHNSYDGISGF